MLQYIAPILQFLIGVLVYDESMLLSRLAGFALVWAALAVFTVDAIRAARTGMDAGEPTGEDWLTIPDDRRSDDPGRALRVRHGRAG